MTTNKNKIFPQWAQGMSSWTSLILQVTAIVTVVASVLWGLTKIVNTYDMVGKMQEIQNTQGKQITTLTKDVGEIKTTLKMETKAIAGRE